MPYTLLNSVVDQILSIWSLFQRIFWLFSNFLVFISMTLFSAFIYIIIYIIVYLHYILFICICFGFLLLTLEIDVYLINFQFPF